MSENPIPARGRPRSPVHLLFGALFGAVYLIALAPPVYIGVTKIHDVVLGLPLSVWYLFLVSGIAVALCAGLYAYESARGELD